MGVAIAAMEVITERERLDMVEDIEEDMVEDTGDDFSDNLNFLTAFDFCDSCILSSPGYGLLTNIGINIVHSRDHCFY